MNDDNHEDMMLEHRTCCPICMDILLTEMLLKIDPDDGDIISWDVCIRCDNARKDETALAYAREVASMVENPGKAFTPQMLGDMLLAMVRGFRILEAGYNIYDEMPSDEFDADSEEVA